MLRLEATNALCVDDNHQIGHRYYDRRVVVICSDLLEVLGRIYDEVKKSAHGCVSSALDGAEEFWPLCA